MNIKQPMIYTIFYQTAWRKYTASSRDRKMRGGSNAEPPLIIVNCPLSIVNCFHPAYGSLENSSNSSTPPIEKPHESVLRVTLMTPVTPSCVMKCR